MNDIEDHLEAPIGLSGVHIFEDLRCLFEDLVTRVLSEGQFFLLYGLFYDVKTVLVQSGVVCMVILNDLTEYVELFEEGDKVDVFVDEGGEEFEAVEGHRVIVVEDYGEGGE